MRMWKDFGNVTFITKTYLIVTGYAKTFAFSNSLVQSYFLAISLFRACTCKCLLKARFETGNNILYNEKKKGVFSETELTENRICALDLKNKGSQSHSQLAPKKLNLPSLLSSSLGGREKGRSL